MSLLRHIAWAGLLLAGLQGASAQDGENTSKPITDGSLWLSLGVDYKPFAKKSGDLVERKFNRNFKINAEVGWRTNDIVSNTSQVNLNLTPEYKLTDYLKVGAQYRYIIKDIYTSNIQRITLQASLSGKKDRIKLDNRFRYQHEFRDVTTLRTVLRDRLGVEYNIPKWQLDPHVSAEAFYGLHYTGNQFVGMRYELGTELAFDKKKRRTLDLAVRYDQELNTDGPENTWILVIAFQSSYRKK